MRQMHDTEAMVMLKRVSRSFYLSVRILPRPMRRGVCIGYLLARASDTLADAQEDPGLLHAFQAALDAGGGWIPCRHPPGTAGEQHLLANLNPVIAAMHALPDAEAALVREVVGTILSGQMIDMRRFAGADARRVVSLADDDELEDYTWRVAGCVGRFWTRLGFATLGDRFSRMPPAELEALGVRFGNGLQLVNILRDAGEDLANGRCYLPSCRDVWLARARECMDAGMAYAAAMRMTRLDVAVALPARIGIDTLGLLEVAGEGAARDRVKMSRRQVWRHLFCGWKSSLSRRFR